MLEKQIIDARKTCKINKFRQNGNPTEKQLRAGNTAERVKTEAGGSRRPVWGRGGESATVRPPEREGASGRLATRRQTERGEETRRCSRHETPRGPRAASSAQGRRTDGRSPCRLAHDPGTVKWGRRRVGSRGTESSTTFRCWRFPGEGDRNTSP